MVVLRPVQTEREILSKWTSAQKMTTYRSRNVHFSEAERVEIYCMIMNTLPNQMGHESTTEMNW